MTSLLSSLKGVELLRAVSSCTYGDRALPRILLRIQRAYCMVVSVANCLAVIKPQNQLTIGLSLLASQPCCRTKCMGPVCIGLSVHSRRSRPSRITCAGNSFQIPDIGSNVHSKPSRIDHLESASPLGYGFEAIEKDVLTHTSIVQ